MKITKKQFERFMNAVTGLSERVKHDLQKDGCISDKTVLALNELTIATNEIEDFVDEATPNKSQLN